MKLIIAVLMLMGMSAFGRVGEKFPDLLKRYGNVVERGEELSRGKYCTFKRHGIGIRCYFYKDRVIAIRFSNVDFETATLLGKLNTGERITLNGGKHETVKYKCIYDYGTLVIVDKVIEKQKQKESKEKIFKDF